MQGGARAENSDNGFVRASWLPGHTGGKLAVPSNVTRITRALLPRSAEGVPQIVYYQAGLGSENNPYSYVVGGFLGSGISENIREAYAFICNNYEDGDDIVLVGFSRGAFTARSISALIAEVGLLTSKGLDSFYPIYKDWENQVNPDYKPEYGSLDWPVDRPRFRDAGYEGKLFEAGLTRPHIPIKAVAVWDTVGTLGIPELDVAGFKLFDSERKEYSFVNTEVAPNVEYAFQALALDEERKTFAPTIWESPKPGSPSRLKRLRQCWFPGVHSSIGGGYADTSISDISLAWMISQLQPLLTFDAGFILTQQQHNKRFYEAIDVPVRSWAMGQIRYSDSSLLNAMTGKHIRTPGEYHAIDSATGKPMERMLTNTCEFMHPSVRYRIDQQGPGLAHGDDDPGKGVYEPLALKGWTYVPPGQEVPESFELESRVNEWMNFGKWVVKREGIDGVFVVEPKIEQDTAEMALVDAWPDLVEKDLQYVM
ncbi:hypothetical protein LTR53_005550 [Teratosphaeriaceae sp. CCFEE 6253]|nr:hypothetical protein LTR53_005550 [Teratosphaeriaceae sp. CCFEE 6253]